jgi:hypothetical protein
MNVLATIPSELKKFENLLQKIVERQDAQALQLEEIINKVTYTELSTKQNNAKFMACAVGFNQTKEACTALLERLDEACGTITEQTWND